MYPSIIDWLIRHDLAWLALVVPRPGYAHAAVFIVMAVLFVRRAKQVGLPSHQVWAFVLWTGMCAVIGARLFYLLTAENFRGLPLKDWFRLQGTASWGAYLGGTLGACLYGRCTRSDMLPYLDVLASLAGIAHVIGRWGCWLAGDDFGRVSHLPWAITFPSPSPPYRAHVAAGWIPATAPASLPVHPLQFYFMATGAIIFWLCTAAWRRWRKVPGTTLALFLVVTGAIRFPLEFLRDPAAGGASSGLSVSHTMSLVLVAAGIGVGWLRLRALSTPPPR